MPRSYMQNFFRLFAVALAMSVHAAPASAQASKDFDSCRANGESFGHCMEYMMDRNGAGCTAARKQIKRQKASAAKEGYHLAFAGRKDSTITGIRGCGYAWNTNMAKAQADAMKYCKESEAKYGTGNGEKICSLME